MPPEETLLIATGSQGESGAALHRLARDDHPDLNLAAGDHVIFSAKTIPGNEIEVQALVHAFRERQIKVTHADESERLLHASGHPHADELADMYAWLRPGLAIPVHGEQRHMECNARIAKESGVPTQIVGKNGDVFDLLGRTKLPESVSAGRLWLEEDAGKLFKVEA